MGIKPNIGSVVASANQQYSMASLFSVTAAAGDPAFSDRRWVGPQ